MMESTSLVLGLSSIISPYKKKELPNTYVQVLFFLFVYTTARSLWWNGVLKPNGWEYDVGGDTYGMIGALTAIVHSSNLLLPLFSLILTHPTKKPGAPVRDSSDLWNWKAWTIISWCQAYMLQDAFWILYGTFDPETMTVSPSSDDTMFLLHHFATTFYMATAKGYQAGHYSAMLLMWMGEVTNPVHNTYEILKTTMRLYPGDNVKVMLPLFGKAFAASYGVARIVVGPLMGVWIVADLMFTRLGRKNVGWVGLLWSVMIAAVLHGSFGFAIDVALKAW